MYWIVLIIVLVVWLVSTRWKQKRFLLQHNLKESGIFSLPIFGHSLHFIGDDEVHMQAIKKIGYDAIEKGGACALWMFNYLYIGIADPAIAEKPLKFCLEKGQPVSNLLKSVTGNGSIFAPVSVWQPRRRKVITPHFKLKSLVRFVEVFAHQSSILAQRLRGEAGKNISMLHYFTAYTMDSVFESSLGYKVNAQGGPNPLLVMLNEGMRLMAARLVSPWLYSDIIYKLHPSCHKLQYYKKKCYQFIESIVKELEEKNYKNEVQHTMPTFLGLFNDMRLKGMELSQETLHEETLAFVIEGTDTSAAALGFTSMCLAKYQEIQDKVYKELKEIFGDSDRLVTVHDLPKLTYLECVINESLRQYPPAPLLMREVDKELKLENGIHLPKGSNLCIFVHGIHHNPAYWGADVEEFRPERFLEPLKHPVQFIPFSYGPRNCAGNKYAMMSLKTVFATLLRQYRILPASTNHDGKQLNDATPRMKFDVMLKEVSEFTVRLELR